ncbi:hypothetical protein ACFC09_07130 [Streptomyces sp. NPDC056161]
MRRRRTFFRSTFSHRAAVPGRRPADSSADAPPRPTGDRDDLRICGG